MGMGNTETTKTFTNWTDTINDLLDAETAADDRLLLECVLATTPEFTIA